MSSARVGGVTGVPFRRLPGEACTTPWALTTPARSPGVQLFPTRSVRTTRAPEEFSVLFDIGATTSGRFLGWERQQYASPGSLGRRSYPGRTLARRARRTLLAHRSCTAGPVRRCVP